MLIYVHGLQTEFIKGFKRKDWSKQIYSLTWSLFHCESQPACVSLWITANWLIVGVSGTENNVGSSVIADFSLY